MSVSLKLAELLILRLSVIQVNVPDGSHCLIKGKKMRLLQWHFHTPSEHAFGGARMAMEAHFVHKNVSTGSPLFEIVNTDCRLTINWTLGIY